MNPYTDCDGNPIARIDPSGLCWVNSQWRPYHTIQSGLVCAHCAQSEPKFTYNSKLTYQPNLWNNKTFQEYTNCYSYAFNMLFNPLTGNLFPEGGMQPGMLSGEINYDNPSKKDIENYYFSYSGTEEGNRYLVDLIKGDMATVGISFIPYVEGMTGGYVVALVVKPGGDYHWYRQDSDGTWSHKQGQLPATQSVGYYRDKNGNLRFIDDLITDPKKAAEKIGYDVFVGYFYVIQRIYNRYLDPSKPVEWQI